MAENNLEQEVQVFNWEEEATAIIDDIKDYVDEIKISSVLISDANNIYLNLRTIEGATACVNVFSRGFRIVSSTYDTIDQDKEVCKDDEIIYETPYALLDKISPQYVKCFGESLCKQLSKLKHERTQFNEEDEESVDADDEDEEDDDEDEDEEDDEDDDDDDDDEDENEGGKATKKPKLEKKK